MKGWQKCPQCNGTGIEPISGTFNSIPTCTVCNGKKIISVTDKSLNLKIMRLDEVKITLPIVDSKKSENYALILIDSAQVVHYFNFDGTYDGYSHDPHICGGTGTTLN